MRHGKKTVHLSRKKGAREALLTGLAKALILHKSIKTTLPKAKALRPFIEPILTKAKVDTTHHRRYAFARLKHKEPVKILFDQISPQIATRPGGYTRIIRLAPRVGDRAPMALIELVDYNYLFEKSTPKASKTRRSRKKKAQASAHTTPAAAQEAPQAPSKPAAPDAPAA